MQQMGCACGGLLCRGCESAPTPQHTQVICIDNFFTGSKDNILHLLDKPNFELIRHDVVEPILLEVDQVFHLACPASPIHYKYVCVLTLQQQ